MTNNVGGAGADLATGAGAEGADAGIAVAVGPRVCGDAGCSGAGANVFTCSGCMVTDAVNTGASCAGSEAGRSATGEADNATKGRDLGTGM